MKHFLMGLAALACTVFTGCASLHDASAPRYEVDAAKMEAIERVARNNGVGVHWVNPPQRRVPAGT